MKEWMTQRKNKIQYAQNCDFSEIRTIHHPRRYYLYENVTEMTDKGFFLKINELVERLERQDTECDYDVAYMQYPQEINQGIYDEYHNAILLLSKKIRDPQIRVLPEGEYLTAYHIGHWETIGEAYKRLNMYREGHHICTEGNYLEYYVVDSFTAKGIEDYVTEISIKIAGKADK